MLEQPLQPFALPTGVFEKLSLAGIVSPTLLIQWTLITLLVFWALYTLIAIYHWLRYAHNLLAAISSIALHLFVSYAIVIFALSASPLP